MTSKSRTRAASDGLPKLSFGSRLDGRDLYSCRGNLTSNSFLRRKHAKRKLEETVCR